jgi:hypothetical protein
MCMCARGAGQIESSDAAALNWDRLTLERVYIMQFETRLKLVRLITGKQRRAAAYTLVLNLHAQEARRHRESSVAAPPVILQSRRCKRGN